MINFAVFSLRKSISVNLIVGYILKAEVITMLASEALRRLTLEQWVLNNNLLSILNGYFVIFSHFWYFSCLMFQYIKKRVLKEIKWNKMMRLHQKSEREDHKTKTISWNMLKWSVELNINIHKICAEFIHNLLAPHWYAIFGNNSDFREFWFQYFRC